MYIHVLLNVIGRAVLCGKCAQGNFRYNCRDTSPDSCQLCDACNAGEYRVSCGTWTDAATCQPFQQCSSDHHLVPFKLFGRFMPPLYCVCCTSVPTTGMPDSQNRQCSKCSQLPPCDGMRTAPASIPAANNTTQTTFHPRSAALLAPSSSAVVLADARSAALLALAS